MIPISQSASTLPEEVRADLTYTLRRHFVDSFYAREVARLPARCRVLDLGGNRLQGRGRFHIGAHDLEVVFANYVPNKRPDVQADGRQLPFANGAFDAVICAEVLEHVDAPQRILAEAFRVLKHNGKFLATVPFLFRIHADPHDYGRYTDTFWHQALLRTGFSESLIEKQGRFWCVLADMLRGWAVLAVDQGAATGLKRLCATRLALWTRARALSWDNTIAQHPDWEYLNSHTTGFGIVATKPCSSPSATNEERP